MIFILYLYHLSKQCRPLSYIISFTICLVSTLDQHCLSNYFIWVLGNIWANWLCSNNIEMSFLSALMVNASVNTLSVISGRFLNCWVGQVLSRTNKMSSLRTQHIGPVSLEQVALQILGCSWFHRRSAVKLFKLREAHREIYTTTWLGQNIEGSVFSLQPANVSTITSSAKTPNQAGTVQISTWTATMIWTGPH